MPTGSYRDVFINHIHVVSPSGSYAVQIAPSIYHAFSDHRAVLAMRKIIRASFSNYQFIFCLINAVNLAAFA